MRKATILVSLIAHGCTNAPVMMQLVAEDSQVSGDAVPAGSDGSELTDTPASDSNARQADVVAIDTTNDDGGIDAWQTNTQDAQTEDAPRPTSRILYMATHRPEETSCSDPPVQLGERSIFVPRPIGTSGRVGCGNISDPVYGTIPFRLRACATSGSQCEDIEGSFSVRGTHHSQTYLVLRNQKGWPLQASGANLRVEVTADRGDRIDAHIQFWVKHECMVGFTMATGIPGRTTDPNYGDLWLYDCPLTPITSP